MTGRDAGVDMSAEYIHMSCKFYILLIGNTSEYELSHYNVDEVERTLYSYEVNLHVWPREFMHQ